MTEQQLVFDWGRWYIQTRDWPVFLLSTDSSGGKVPARNCSRCREGEGYDGHDRERCPCLLCHGFYAATKDPERLWYMVQALPRGFLAVRTGRASGVLVLDVEAKDRGQELSGVELLDRWDLLNDWTLPPTLTARSVSGGLHLYYAYPDDDRRVGSATLVRDALEVKADGGYVGLPCGRNDRRWADPLAPVVTPPPELLTWLATPRRLGVGSGHGAVTAGSFSGGSGPLPSTEWFIEHGLGAFTGSRNKDWGRLSFRLWNELRTEDEVRATLMLLWEQTDQTNSTWSSLWGTALQTRRRWRAARDQELEAVAVLRRWAR
jgi:hypothetical protein